MREPGIAGITSIECPNCCLRLSDYDPPELWKGRVRVTARCHVCLTEHRFEIDHWRGETHVWAVRSVAWARPD